MKDAFTPKEDAVTDLAHRHKMSSVARSVNTNANRGARVLNIRPISLKDANDYIIENHRHHDKVQGHKFSEACYDGDRLCGVAVVGRPVARHLDDGKTLEVTRLCTDGTKNACSILYARCAKIAKDMGYTKIITYILESEHGSSLLASGWTCEDDNCGGASWDHASRPREVYTDMQVSMFGEAKLKYPINMKKKRYAKELI